MLITLYLALAPLAWAQEDPAASGFDAHGFSIAAMDGDPRDPMTVQRPGAFEGGDFFFTGVFEFADRPLVQIVAPSNGGAGTEHVVLDDLLTLNASAGVAVHDLVRLDASFPFYVMNKGMDPENPYQFVSTGDATIGALVEIVRPPHIEGGGGPGFGIYGRLGFPTGTPTRFLGNQGLSGSVVATGTYELGIATFSADAGLKFNPKVSLANLANADQVSVGGAVGFLFGNQQNMGLNLELRSLLALQKGDGAVPEGVSGTGSPAEGMLSFRARTQSGPWFVLGAGGGITPGAGASTFRVIAGIGGGRVQPPRPPDLDTVGMFTTKDACPNEPETENGWRDDDGCPDELGALQVRVTYNGEPVPGASLTVRGPDTNKSVNYDQPLSFKAIPGTSWSAEASAADKCLVGSKSTTVRENGGDLEVQLARQLDAKVRFEVVGPNGEALQPGAAAWRSQIPTCLPDSTLLPLNPDASIAGLSGDQTIGHGTHTFVVDVPGYKPHEETVEVPSGGTKLIRITMQPALVVLQKTKIEILEKVFFEFNKATIKPESFDLLDQVADVINTHPDIGRVEIGGHTDDKGKDAYNLKLSQDRADSVKAYLEGKGVPGAGLIAVGYGETRAIDLNTTEEGRANNRRVEFNLIDQKDNTVETPVPGGTP